MRIVLVVSAIVFAAVATPAAAWTSSCSSLAAACMRHETALGKAAAARCLPRKRACLRRCKAGKPAYFVGPSSGRVYPADVCA